MKIGGILKGSWVLMLPSDDELPPLHRAARLGDLEQVSRCLEGGADPNSLAIVQHSDREIEWMQADTRSAGVDQPPSPLLADESCRGIPDPLAVV